MAADPSLSPELIEARSFTSGFRGYDQSEVRDFLSRVATEVRSLRERVDRLESAWHSAEERAARPPVLDEETLIAAVGEETASILRAARTAASDLRTRAAQDAERMVGDAQTRASEVRSEAEAVLTRETRAAEEAAARLIDAARSDAAEMVDKARGEADAVRSAAQQERNLTVEGAIATRERILDDLSRRRRVASVQIEQLRAGRERLLESYAVVRRTLEEVNDELNRADAEARAAADEVGRRMQRDHHPEPSRPAAAGGEGTAAATRGSEVAGAIAVGEDAGSGETGETGAGEAAQGRDRTAAGPVATEPGSLPRRVPPNQGSVLIPPGGPTRGGGEITSGGAEALAAAIDPVDDPSPPAEATATPHLRVVADEPTAGSADRPEEPATTAARHSAPGSKVDVLFARIRAGRAGVHAHPSSGPGEPDATATQPTATQPTATQPTLVPAPGGGEGTVAAGTDTGGVQPDPPTADPTNADPTNADPTNAERTVITQGGGEGELSQADQDLMAGRQAVLAGLELSLTRKLKRALQDEQNDLLDRLRSFRGEPTVAAPPARPYRPDRPLRRGGGALSGRGRPGRRGVRDADART